MNEPFATIVKGFLFKPTETFRLVQPESLNSAYQYYVRLIIIYAVLLFALIAGAIALSGSASTVASGGLGSKAAFLVALRPFLETFVLFLPYFLFMLFLFIVFVYGLELHVFVLLFGGQQGLVRTLKVPMYAMTPFFLFGWIPFVNIVMAVWSYILLIIGIREYQEVTTGRAILVAVVPLVLTTIFYICMFVLIGSYAHAMPYAPWRG